MAISLQKFCTNLNKNINPTLITAIRHGHRLRGKPPGVAKTITQRLEALNVKDPSIDFKVDIGLPAPARPPKARIEERLNILKAQRKNRELEKLARNKKLLVNVDDVNKEWSKTCFFHHIRKIADHFGVFDHLFGDAYFNPLVPLTVLFNNGDFQHPVYFGNIIKPSLATAKPEVQYESDDETLWSLLLTNPDGHFEKQDREYVHWFVGNIPGNKIEKGEVIVDYLQPFPPKGTGYHRHVFVLYKQSKKLDFSQLKKTGPCLNLSERTFSTLDFYKNRQDELTPAGLAFFQSDWDSSLTDFYHNILDMKEPIFEYDFPPPHIRKQEWFPLRKPFNLYMDKYRDPKKINKEYLTKKLNNVHPFRPSPPPLPFPNAVGLERNMPSWLKLETVKNRMKWGRINDIEKKY